MPELPLHRDYHNFTVRIYDDQIEDIRVYSEKERVYIGIAVRHIIDLGLEVIKKKQCNGVHYCRTCSHELSSEELIQIEIKKILENVVKEQNVKRGAERDSKFCQCCGKPLHPRKRHDVVVGDQIYTFGDCCYYNDSYKSFITRVL